MPTFDTPEPITATIDLAMGDVRISADDARRHGRPGAPERCVQRGGRQGRRADPRRVRERATAGQGAEAALLGEQEQGRIDRRDDRVARGLARPRHHRAGGLPVRRPARRLPHQDGRRSHQPRPGRHAGPEDRRRRHQRRPCHGPRRGHGQLGRCRLATELQGVAERLEGLDAGRQVQAKSRRPAPARALRRAQPVPSEQAMPEGDTIHYAAHRMRPVLEGRVPDELATPHPRFARRPLAREAGRPRGRGRRRPRQAPVPALRGRARHPLAPAHDRRLGRLSRRPALGALGAARVARPARRAATTSCSSTAPCSS